MIQLQDRDLEICRCCYEQGFLKYEHFEFFFQRGSWKRAYERARQLIDHGYLKPDSRYRIGTQQILRLTRSGRDWVESETGLKNPPRHTLHVPTLRHDAIVTSVRLRLQQLWEAQWIPERFLKQSEYSAVPDGVVVFPDGGRIIVEVENSLKGYTRAIQLFGRWRQFKCELALYVATSEQVHSGLKRYMSECKDLPLGLVQWDALKMGEPAIWSPTRTLSLFGAEAHAP